MTAERLDATDTPINAYHKIEAPVVARPNSKYTIASAQLARLTNP